MTQTSETADRSRGIRLRDAHTSGDGMRSFVGVLLHTLVSDHPVILIDEPEAFLHPPQARLLAQMLIKEAPLGRQLFIATHSGDFLRGLLDSNSTRVRIIRIQRRNAVNPIKELDNEGVRKVWGDPILSYSNVLDGLFHSKVILCESDSDCRFYGATMDAFIDQTGEGQAYGFSDVPRFPWAAIPRAAVLLTVCPFGQLSRIAQPSALSQIVVSQLQEAPT